jgi:hypothetical protein
MEIVAVALIAVWFVVIPVAVARFTSDRTGGRLAFLFVLMMFLTTVWGALVYLVAHRWYRNRLPAAPIEAGASVSSAKDRALGVAGPDAG